MLRAPFPISGRADPRSGKSRKLSAIVVSRRTWRTRRLGIVAGDPFLDRVEVAIRAGQDRDAHHAASDVPRRRASPRAIT